MIFIGHIGHNTLSIEPGKRPGIYVAPFDMAFVRSQNGMVYLVIDGQPIELSTITAHKIGFDMATMIPTLENDELIVLNINGRKLELLKDIAKKISTGLLRKADDADDWQLNNRR